MAGTLEEVASDLAKAAHEAKCELALLLAAVKLGATDVILGSDVERIIANQITELDRCVTNYNALTGK